MDSNLSQFMRLIGNGCSLGSMGSDYSMSFYGNGSITIKCQLPLSKNVEKLIWESFQSNVNQTVNSESLNPRERVQVVSKILSEFCTVSKIAIDCPNTITEGPSKYLNTAIVLHAVVKEVLLKKVSEDHRLKIVNSSYDESLDLAEQHIVKVFDEVIQYYFEQETESGLKEAFNVASQINHTKQGQLALITCSEKFTNLKALKESLDALSYLTATVGIEDQFLLSIENIRTKFSLTDIMPVICSMENTQIKNEIFQKFIQGSLKESNVDEAFFIIKNIEDKYKRDQEREKLIEFFMNNNDIDSVKGMISSIEDKYERDQERKKLIEFFMNNNDIDSVKGMISSIEDKYKRDQEREKLIKFLKNNRGIGSAGKEEKMASSIEGKEK